MLPENQRTVVSWVGKNQVSYVFGRYLYIWMKAEKSWTQFFNFIVSLNVS